MTTATAAQTPIDFELPAELPDRGRQWVGKVTVAGAYYPPKQIADKTLARGETVYPMIHLAADPLSFKYNSDRSKGFEDDEEHLWLAMQDKKGAQVGPGSNLDDVQKAFAKLGFAITNNATLQALVGLNFVFETKKKTFKFNRGKDAEGQDIVEESNSYIWVPVELAPQDYEHVGTIQVIPRPRVAAGSAPTAASVDMNATVALPKLAAALDGKTEAEYFNALTSTKDPDLMRPPYVVEANTDPHQLTLRMISSGLMKQVGDTVVKS